MNASHEFLFYQLKEQFTGKVNPPPNTRVKGICAIIGGFDMAGSGKVGLTFANGLLIDCQIY